MRLGTDQVSLRGDRFFQDSGSKHERAMWGEGATPCGKDLERAGAESGALLTVSNRTGVSVLQSQGNKICQ